VIITEIETITITEEEIKTTEEVEEETTTIQMMETIKETIEETTEDKEVKEDLITDVTVIVLHTFIEQVYTKNLDHTGDAQDSMDELADKLIDKLVGQMLASGPSPLLTKAASPGTILGKPVISPRSTMPLSQAFAQYKQSSANAMRGSYMQPSAAVSPLSAYHPQMHGGAFSPAPPVRAMQDTLKSYGMPSSPIQTLALTAIAGTRDVSMAAQANRMWKSMDAKDKDIIVRAARVAKKAEVLPGVNPPFGFWDPWGISTNAPDAEIYFWRECELKHGRLGMIASLGVIAGETFSPLFGAEPGIPAAYAIESTTNPIFWVITLIEVSRLDQESLEIFGSIERFEQEYKKQKWTLTSGRIPGDYGFDPLGLKPKKPEDLKVMQEREINNGRLGMIAAVGMLQGELITGQPLFGPEGAFR